MTHASDRPANRLRQETSPYLRQHAHNPVDWYPWGDEALARAAAEDKPIFLSIGYSACHWCHVMERESFENDEIAAVMNAHFVNIKVDREERPDLDQIYMNAVLALSGRGGWPMSVFLAPDGRPFYGGTYWPPAARMGMPGFRDILLRVHELWSGRREELLRGAAELTDAVRRMGEVDGGAATLDVEILRHAQQSATRTIDRTYGGFGGAPKFPHPMDLRAMLRCARRFAPSEALELAILSLDKMAAGGIYDHLGGGFHRYATDHRWLVPHFEKMLYDNALLVPAYLEAWQLSGDERHARVVRETLDYVLREMTSPQGGFYSTQDADSEGVEGKFFVWDRGEVWDLLGDDTDLFGRCYDVTDEGNWEEHNILQRLLTDEQAAALFERTPEEVAATLSRCRMMLFEHRGGRVAPGRDDKIIAAWNGLMISAMARGGFALDEPRYLEAAGRAADFVLERMRDGQGKLMRVWMEGRARFAACLDDVAGIVDGLVELFLAGGENRHLDAAIALTEDMLARYADPDSGGLFFTAADHEPLIARNLDTQDGATPSGNALAATALLKLGRVTARADFDVAAEKILTLLSGQMSRVPLASGQGLIALDLYLGPAYEAVFFPGSDAEENGAVRDAFRRAFRPHVLFWEVRPEHAGSPWLEAHLCGRQAEGGRATLFLCERGRCERPLSGRAAILERLATL